jgi:hypothetical protein
VGSAAPPAQYAGFCGKPRRFDLAPCGGGYGLESTTWYVLIRHPRSRTLLGVQYETLRQGMCPLGNPCTSPRARGVAARAPTREGPSGCGGGGGGGGGGGATPVVGAQRNNDQQFTVHQPPHLRAQAILRSCERGFGCGVEEDLRHVERFSTTSPEDTLTRVIGFFEHRRPLPMAVGMACFGPLDPNHTSPWVVA